MSVVETNTIDAIGITKDGNGVTLLITDHLDWQDEYEHLLILQEKINAYLSFLEDEQYTETYPDFDPEYAIIEIRFLHKITNNCKMFLETVQKQIEPIEIELHVEIG